MTLESSVNTTSSRSDWHVQPNRLGEFYGEFLRERSTRSRPDDLGGSTGILNGVIFGQKAPLKPSSSPVSVNTPEKAKRPWNFPGLTFSDLASHGDPAPRSSPLRQPPTPTSTQGVAGDVVETDLARSHPNSGDSTYPLPFFNGDIATKPYGGLTKADRLDPFLSRKKNGPHWKKRANVPGFTTFPLPVSQPTSFILPDKVTSSSPHTPSPTSPPTHPHLSHNTYSSTPSQGISDYDLVDTVVKFHDRESSPRTVCTGVVTKVSSDKIATIKDQFSGKTTKIRCSDLRLVQPATNDAVKVVYPNNRILGKIGTLLSVTGDSGIVQFVTINGNIGPNLAQVKLSQLGKYIKPPEPSSLTTSVELNGNPTSKSVWGSAVLCGTTFPFAPFAVPTVPAVPFQLPLATTVTTSYPLFGQSPLHSGSAVNSNATNGLSSPTLDSTRTSGDSLSHHSNPLSGMPLSFQICPGTSSSSSSSLSFFRDSPIFSEPICRGGGDNVEDGRTSRDSVMREKTSFGGSGRFAGRLSGASSFRRTSSGPQEVSDIIERLLAHQRRYHVKKDDDNMDVKASCVRVSLVCPISQKRLKYPSRGFQCKHLQCFDAEAYILMNLNHKPKARVKQANGRSLVQPLPTKKWHCPICLKYVHETQLYIDKSLMSVITELRDPVTEVELNENGTWQPYKKVVTDIIDLTADDD